MVRLILTTLLAAFASGSHGQENATADGARGLSSEQQENILARHNHWRETVGAPALEWSAEVAAFAQEWADELAKRGCEMEHRPRSGPFTQKYGENLSWASPTTWSDGRTEAQVVSPSSVVDGWDSEKADYDYASNTCAAGKACGHYTQVVWAKSERLGCAMTVCADKGQIWVCNYDPAGNFNGEKPY